MPTAIALTDTLGSLASYFYIVLAIFIIKEIIGIFMNLTPDGQASTSMGAKIQEWNKKRKEDTTKENAEKNMVLLEEAEINRMLTEVNTLRSLLAKSKAADVNMTKVEPEAKRLVVEYQELRKFEQLKLKMNQVSDKLKSDSNLKSLMTKDLSIFEVLSQTINKLVTDLERISGVKGAKPEAGLKDAKSGVLRLERLLLLLRQIDREELNRIKVDQART